MSVFQPAARVMDPNGRGWEIYVFRILLPERSAGDSPLEHHGGIARGEMPKPRNAQLLQVDYASRSAR